MNILFLDLATKTGFAIYNEDTLEVISYGRKVFNGSEIGAKLKSCHNWLKELMSMYDVLHVVVEDVYIPFADEHKNTTAFKRLSEYHGILKYLCFDRCICCETVEASSHHTSLLGWQAKNWKRERIKEETIKRIKCMGYDITSDDEADAISIMRYWCKRTDKEIIAPNGHTYKP